MIRKWALWITLAVVAATALLAYQSAVFSSRSGDAAPLYSIRRHDAYGAAALFTLLSESDIPTDTLERPAFHAGETGTLIQILQTNARSRETLPQPQVSQLVDWMTQGNTVIQFTRSQTDLMDRLGIKADTQPDSKAVTALQTAETSGDAPDKLPAGNETGTLATLATPSADAAGLSLTLPMTLADAAKGVPFKVLARPALDKKKILAAEYRVGLGRLIVVGAPTPALNHMIPQRQNLEFILSLVGNKPVWFDEWSHGIGHNATVIGFLKEAGLIPLLLQVAFVVGLYVWSTSGRSATGGRYRAPRGRVAVEQISTLGYLYARSLELPVTFTRVNAEAQRRLATAFRCKPTELRTAVDRAASPWKERGRQLLDRLAGLQATANVRCTTCGYDLRGNTTGRCPECGANLRTDTVHRIAEIDASATAVPANAVNKAALIELLNDTHALSEEIRSARHAAR